MIGRRMEERHALAAGLQALPAAEILSRLLVAQGDAVAALRPALSSIAAAADLARAALSGAGRLAYVGAGSAGLMALADGLELAGTFGVPPARTPILFAGGAAALLHMTGDVEDDAALSQADLAALAPTAADVAICVSASGTTPYTLAVARGVKAAGGRVIAIANVSGAPLLSLADVAVLIDSGPEMVAGSTRLGAATTQKIALNMISTLVGIGLGHVHEGYMVNLLPENAKLRDRAARIVAALSGCDDAQAARALATTKGAVKPAILIAAGASADTAQSLLADSGGHLGPALARLAGPPTNERP
ncbi:MAG: N-acetylmuramic acid 6-phosphate etherase [Rhodobacteraceae bacterium]|nr:N-acetylmuramic acid 6-phosphate etherase [Paracoccaceae bacterium]